MLEFGKVKMTADARTQEARSFLKAAQWRVLNMRSTSAGKGAEGAAPRFRMRVYAKGCPVHALREVHLLLNADNPLTDPVVDGVVQPGKWWHRGAGWSKDEGAGERGTGTCTLVRDLYDGEIADTQFLEDGCGSRTKVIFYFDAPSVVSLADVAESGTQGFSVRLGGVSLDRETGLYSYYVTVTESKTLILDEHKVMEDAFRTRYDADYLGLRGDVDKPKDSGGESVSVPKPGVPEAGTLITNQWGRNREDCTLNAQVGKEVAILVDEAAVSHARNLYNKAESVSAVAASAKLGDAPVPADGVTKRHVSRLRPDKKWDTEVSTETELPYEQAQVSEKRTLFSRVLTKIAKSVSRGRTAAAASGGTGTSGSASVTPGGRNDLTEVTEEELPVPNARISRSATIFQTEETVTDVHSGGAAPAASAGGGVIVSADESLNPLGSKNIGVSTRTELPVEESQVQESMTVFGREVSTTSHNVDFDNELSAAAGTIKGGGRSKTPGGKKVTVKTERTETAYEQSSVRDSVTPWATVRTVEDTHMPAPHGALSGAGSIGHQVTPGGLYNRTKTELLKVNDGTILSHAKGGDRFSTWEWYTTAESAKNFDTDVGLANAGVPGAATVKTNEFSYDELGYYRKTTRIETAGDILRSVYFASYISFDTGTYGEAITNDIEIGMLYNCPPTEIDRLLALEAAWSGKNEGSVSMGLSLNKFGLCGGNYRIVRRTPEKPADGEAS